ncbi:glycine betaine/proline transport system permease protein [Actinobaculum suis]|uniref:Glycine betaine/proline transport system permease protein n=1 Tax=Actinobaculum suis TaxID=1657 RepID=A0A0K9ETK0_9ACTO|nr:proline/glycine betaine ABC transporter permease [Actinobaculum suis]KMY23504.1 hypothetical protein ACU19_03460 [Actinobaculum suis]MDY5153330.1 proline/glycine betaine ABC transporter permease [Actinobaculum suis]OCA96014.1 glycine/betaine ABC transporter [Actinobaculum suis]OCA96133.1 glycine/betaine ABC transporter [Actinobaculum suis]SDE48072.1 glycine betaine/proline transport system permease protein [Actinobaculum suis]
MTHLSVALNASEAAQRFRIPLGEWVDTFIDWLTTHLEGLFDALQVALTWIYDLFFLILSAPPFWLVIAVFAVLAYFARGWGMAIAATLGMLLLVFTNQWDNSMASLALVLESSLIAILLGIPLGIWAAKSATAWRVLRPILDFLQTMPAFVYLIPLVVMFSVGVVPGIVATIFFAIAPAVRFTRLGIIQVDASVVEAAYSFGASPRRVLGQIELPLSLPTIMAGVNQVIMLSLSMVVTAGMVGAGGLGQAVYSALTSVDMRLGAEAGLAVVILAVYLDRVTAGLSARGRREVEAE